MYSEKFIKRIQERIPEGLGVSRQTTPIIYFGNYHTAKSCTISLNPSDREFLDKNGNLLEVKKERLCSRRNLLKADNEELDRSNCEEVISSCENYFQKNPYKQWFNKYEAFLNAFGYSYYNGDTVHLDLVQWATTPFWGELEISQKNELLKRDLPFLEHLLEKDFEHVFLNGKTTVLEASKHLGLKLNERKAIYNGKNIIIYSGNYNKSVVIGWSPYIQSANVGGYEKIHELASLVRTFS